MTNRPRLGLSSQQRLQINPGLNQGVALLRMDGDGLAAYLEREAADNPWLQISPAPATPPRDWLPRWQAHAGSGAAPDTANAGPSLMAHVMAKVGGMALSPDQAFIALELIEALEPTGWMTRPLTEIAEALNQATDRVEAVLYRLQQIEPRGLFARNLAECLRLQAMDAGRLDAAMTGVLANLAMLANGQTARLAKILNLAETVVLDRLAQLRGFNPKPGTLFDPLTPAHAREPDLILRPAPKGQGSGGWSVTVNRAALPAHRLSSQKPVGEDQMTALARARSLVGMINARNQTLVRVAEAILAHQGRAVTVGAEAIVPLTMADIGIELDLHESTISRAVAGTSMDGPLGTIWLRTLFSPEVARAPDGRAMSKAALKAALVRLIRTEDRNNPLRDADLTTALARDCGIVLARRTTASYREAAGIPIAGRRGVAEMARLAGKRPERSQSGLSRRAQGPIRSAGTGADPESGPQPRPE